MGDCEVSRIDTSQHPDPAVQCVLNALKPYEDQHPNAEIVAYRQNSVSIRIRIVDPDFQGADRVEREKAVWPFLERLPDDVLADITILLLITPDEAGKSFANHDFENPLPSGL